MIISVIISVIMKLKTPLSPLFSLSLIIGLCKMKTPLYKIRFLNSKTVHMATRKSKWETLCGQKVEYALLVKRPNVNVTCKSCMEKEKE